MGRETIVARTYMNGGPGFFNGYYPGRLVEKMKSDPGKGYRSEHVFSVVCSLVELGANDDEIENTIESFPDGVGVKYFEKKNLGPRWLKYTIDAARRHVGRQEDVIW
jgi:hypothetical protein